MATYRDQQRFKARILVDHGQPIDDLHELHIADHCWRDGKHDREEALQDYRTVSVDERSGVFFYDLAAHLTAFIEGAPLLVGCVAWLTHEGILRALARTGGVAMVVQKEDFLRPDVLPRSGWKNKLRSLYAALPDGPERHQYPGLVRDLSVASDGTIDPVRCVGNYNRDRRPAFPRMHHKFAVWCSLEDDPEWTNPYDAARDYEPPQTVVPRKVWTGSFNWTENAARSFENAIVSEDPALVAAYFNEWQQVMALSEPLDWESDWVAPEWRIGT